MTIPDPQSNRYAATIGFFDGVHMGHVHLLEELKSIARERGIKSMAITFPEHPRQILQSDYRPRLLSTPEDKMRQTDVLFRLNVSRRHYYRLKEQAISIISLRLWCAPNSDLDLWLELVSMLSKGEKNTAKSGS